MLLFEQPIYLKPNTGPFQATDIINLLELGFFKPNPGSFQASVILNTLQLGFSQGIVVAETLIAKNG